MKTAAINLVLSLAVVGSAASLFAAEPSAKVTKPAIATRQATPPVQLTRHGHNGSTFGGTSYNAFYGVDYSGGYRPYYFRPHYVYSPYYGQSPYYYYYNVSPYYIQPHVFVPPYDGPPDRGF